METITRLAQLVREGGTGVLATITAVRGSAPRGPGARLLLEPDGTVTGTVGGGEVERAALAAAHEMLRPAQAATRSIEVDSHCGGQVTLFLERFDAQPHLLVVGAGHVGCAIAEIAVRAGFAVEVLARDQDAPPNLAGVAVRSGLGPGSLESVGVPTSAQMIVATGAHEVDVEWGVAALKVGFAGVGVVGSRSKAAALRQAAERAGIDEARRATLRCPVGLDIGAITPGEIALSVVSELIMLRRRGEVPATWRKQPQG